MSRAGGGGSEENRPMTAVRAAGYTAHGKGQGANGTFDPMGGGNTMAGRGPAPPLLQRADNSPEDKCREMEKEVNGLIEESAKLSLHKQYQAALDRAKEAGKLERQLCKKREENGLADQINIDLTYSVCFNLANQHHCCGMYMEALNAYSLIVKNKQYAQSGRLRVNMGNIYYEQKKYSAAIKMYRMALDQIPNTGREIRYKIMRNIGNAFVRLGQFQDAVASFEQVGDRRCPGRACARGSPSSLLQAPVWRPWACMRGCSAAARALSWRAELGHWICPLSLRHHRLRRSWTARPTCRPASTWSSATTPPVRRSA